MELSVNAKRVLNGNWDEFIATVGHYGETIVYMDWPHGSNPIEVAGIPHRNFDSRVKKVVNLPAGNPPYVLAFTSGDSFAEIKIQSTTSFLRLPQTNEVFFKEFATLDDALCYVNANMSHGGKLQDSDNPTIEPLQFGTKVWNLEKETYTKAEVIAIMEEMKEEMVLSTGQLFDRMLKRLGK